MGILAFFKRLFRKSEDEREGFKNGNGNGHGEDLRLSCVECRRSFTFEAGEQKFYKMRGLTPPKRCPSCRGKRRHGRR